MITFYLNDPKHEQDLNNHILLRLYFSNQNKIDLQLEITRYVYAQLKRLNTDGSTVFVNCPTLFDGKEAIIKLITGLITVSDALANAFSFINRIIKVKSFVLNTFHELPLNI